MGQYELLAIALFAIPVLLLMLLRANAAIVFLSLCLGYTISKLLGPDISAFGDMFLPGFGPQNLELGLLVVPGLLTALFYTHSVKGLQAILNGIPALAVSCLLVALVVPILPAAETKGIMSLPIWHEFTRLQSLSLGLGALASLLFLWLRRSPTNKSSADKKSG